jgi:hypothetical protein
MVDLYEDKLKRVESQSSMNHQMELASETLRKLKLSDSKSKLSNQFVVSTKQDPPETDYSRSDPPDGTKSAVPLNDTSKDCSKQETVPVTIKFVSKQLID